MSSRQYENFGTQYYNWMLLVVSNDNEYISVETHRLIEKSLPTVVCGIYELYIELLYGEFCSTLPSSKN